MSNKIYFKYGTMGCGKSLDLIKTYHIYRENKMKAICFKSSIDNRDGLTQIVSRTGLAVDCEIITPEDNVRKMLDGYNSKNTDVILIDEVQFFTTQQINDLEYISRVNNIPILCYGLKVNFKSELFEGSKRIFEIGNEFEMSRSVCWCGKLATQNARIVDGEIVYDGTIVKVGGNESYKPLCYKHYKEGKYGDSEVIN